MRRWGIQLVAVLAGTAGLVWVVTAIPRVPQGPTDGQLRYARRNLEKVTARARQRDDYTSARAALWALLSFTELHAAGSAPTRKG